MLTPVSLATFFCALPPTNTHGTANSILSFFSESKWCCLNPSVSSRVRPSLRMASTIASSVLLRGSLSQKFRNTDTSIVIEFCAQIYAK